MTTSEKNPLIGVRIATDYRAIGHIVEGLLLLLFMTFTFATYGLHTSFVLLSVLGVFEVVRGSLLLRDIINDNQKGLYGYLALSFINFILRHGYGNSSDVRHWFGSNSGRSFDSIYFFVQLFLFFYEGILFCYVVRFYGNIEVFRNEKKGNDNVNVWIRIFTHYRAVAHAVEGLILCSLIVASVGQLFIVYGIFEAAKGTLLLKGIKKESVILIRIYSVLHFSMLCIKIALGIFAAAVLFVSDPVFFITVKLAVLYLTYEWFFFFCVYKYIRTLIRRRQSKQGSEGGIPYEKLGEFMGIEREKNGVEKSGEYLGVQCEQSQADEPSAHLDAKCEKSAVEKLTQYLEAQNEEKGAEKVIPNVEMHI
ncbi:hypothetical protein Zmor_009470 [Zophobas morio]|uniref:Uncharacterized protein n=1 Tax=Zophobas morio TaxID=2755281 RepID=A0AA38MIV3_9CUCU|nr:hypothetical protein Zmor_009470 [Zophobas morio]